MKILNMAVIGLIKIICVGLFLCVNQSSAQGLMPAYTANLPLYDYPYNKDLDFLDPSMNQSLHFSKSFYQFSHYSIQKFWDHRPTASTLSVIAFDIVSIWIPFSYAWVHEEWHRAVMGQYGIDSYDEVYDLEFFSETIAVSDVKDADLVKLKKDHPADMIRLHSAGLESQNQFNLTIETDQFFRHTRSLDSVILLFNAVNTSSYLSVCASDESNSLTNEILSRENQDIKDRDFTGLDCNAWVYDLFKPEEPYENRGTHPSGTGINRYITWSDLTSTEKDYLQKQFYLSFLNFLDPFLLNKRYFQYSYNKQKPPIYWNANLKHYLTPFGYSVNAHLFASHKQHKALLTLHNHFNRHHYFPGVGVELFDIILPIKQTVFRNDLSITLWSQPENFNFETNKSALGARVKINSRYQWSKLLGSFLEVEYKTDGWYEGNVYLSENLSARLGVSFSVY